MSKKGETSKGGMLKDDELFQTSPYLTASQKAFWTNAAKLSAKGVFVDRTPMDSACIRGDHVFPGTGGKCRRPGCNARMSLW